MNFLNSLGIFISKLLGIIQDETELNEDEDLQGISDEIYNIVFSQVKGVEGCEVKRNEIVTSDNFIADIAVYFPKTIYVFYLLDKNLSLNTIGSGIFFVADNIQKRVKAKFHKNCYVLFITNSQVSSYIYDTLRIDYQCVAIQANTEEYISALQSFELLARYDKPPKIWLDITNNYEYQRILSFWNAGYNDKEMGAYMDLDTDVVSTLIRETFSTV